MSQQDTAASPAADNSDTTAPAQADAVQTDVKTTTADTSTAEPGDKSSMFDAVKASLGKPDDSGTPPVPDPKTEPKESAAEAEPEDEEEDAEDKGTLSDEEKKLLSAKTQRRIQKLARQRDDLKEPAERARNLDSFMQTHGISPADAKGAFEVLALMRTNPAEALNRLRNLSYELSLSLGETLPQDIKAKVDAGTIDEATGKELAIARAKANGFKQTAETLTAETREQQVAAFKSQVSQEVSAWEKQIAARDPDFADKQPLVVAEFKALLQSGEQIRVPADGARLMKLAYKNVSENLKKFRPQRSETKAPPANSGTAAKTRPASIDDAIKGSFA